MLSTYGYAVAEADAIDLVQQVLKSPIRAFDTSNAYSEGESERRIGIGIAAAGGLPEDFTVITKVDAQHRLDVRAHRQPTEPPTGLQRVQGGSPPPDPQPGPPSRPGTGSG
jgi:aryl-alcohol dehydrogenase-like predicted oxidoreductase